MLYALYPHKKTDILRIDWTSENYALLDQEGWLDTQSVQLKFHLKTGKTLAALNRYDIIFHLGYLRVLMMLNNSIEVTFYMESNDYINMREIDKILNIKNAEFYSKGDLFTSPNKKVQFIIEHSYYSFGIDKEENLNEKINKIIQKIEDIKKNLNYIFKKYKLNKELIIYSWANDEATREYKFSLNQIQLLSELGIELKIIHYNF